jgi:hypothetical protein
MRDALPASGPVRYTGAPAASLARRCSARPERLHRRGDQRLDLGLPHHQRHQDDADDRQVFVGGAAPLVRCDPDLRTWRQLLRELASRDRGDLATALAELQSGARRPARVDRQPNWTAWTD